MSKVRVVAALLVLLAPPPDAAAQDAAARPNILVFMADDLGWNDVGYHGSEILTPHLDALAAGGVALERFYVFPWCAATRAAFETGINPARFGMRALEHNFADRSALPAGLPTLAALLNDAGYRTGLLGKWHLSRSFRGGPVERGYDDAFGYLHGQLDHVTHDDHNGASSLFRGEQYVSADGHISDLLAAEIERFIAGTGKADVRARTAPRPAPGAGDARPFFLNVAFSAPHYPLQAPRRFIDLNAAIEHPDRRLYAGMVSHMDAVIGATVALLRERGLYHNTLIVFFSDNGGDPQWLNPRGYYDGRHGPYQVMADNAPLRGAKTDVYEGGVRVPALLHYPAALEPAVDETFISVLDLLPTLLALAGATPPARDGRDLGARLFGGGPRAADANPPAPFFWFSYSGGVPYGGGKQDAVRDGDWKLVVTQRRFRWLPWRFEWPWPRVELFNVKDDPYERRDLSDDYPQRAERLEALLDEFRDHHFGAYLR